jgi:hypothetical protein
MKKWRKNNPSLNDRQIKNKILELLRRGILKSNKALPKLQLHEHSETPIIDTQQPDP